MLLKQNLDVGGGAPNTPAVEPAQVQPGAGLGAPEGATAPSGAPAPTPAPMPTTGEMPMGAIAPNVQAG